MIITERQQREQNYYDQYATRFQVAQAVDFSPVMGEEQRPWNSYWYTYQLVAEAKEGKNEATLLDFGSGPGENALRFAKLGYRVEGFDISQKNVEVSRTLFERYGLGDKGHFQMAQAEALSYPDEVFDVVAGIDILHHVDIPKAIGECYRVLKKGGVAIFREPIDVPLWDKVRNLKWVTHFFPKEASLDNHITEDERKLNGRDLEAIGCVFPEMEVKKFLLFSRFDPYVRTENDPRPSFLEKLDAKVMEWVPGVAPLGGAMVVTLRKKEGEP